ncbi:CAD18 protein, partial [Polyodon spathula]|nr:CAD18 protein [Polyodon spathula]
MTSYVMDVYENAEMGTLVGAVTAQDPDRSNSPISSEVKCNTIMVDNNNIHIYLRKSADMETCALLDLIDEKRPPRVDMYILNTKILRIHMVRQQTMSLGILSHSSVSATLSSVIKKKQKKNVFALWTTSIHIDPEDNPSLLSHVPVSVQVLDVNDNPPELASDDDVVVCENSRPGQVIQTISAVDKDDFANGPRFFFSLADELPNNPNFTLQDNEDNTASILARRRRFSRVTQEVYYLPIVISDGGSPSHSSTSTLTLRVCACGRDGKVRTCHAEPFLSSAGLSTGALIAILLCIIILLAIVVLFVTLRRSKKEPLIISEGDVRENVVTYDDEGGGEEDTEAFDIITLRNPAAAEELKFRRDVMPDIQRVRRHSPPLVLDGVDVHEFIKQRQIEADLDNSVPPYDSLQTYAYEGRGSPPGSISSLDSATTHSEQDYNYLCDWGPEFLKLAELFGEESQQTT